MDTTVNGLRSTGAILIREGFSKEAHHIAMTTAQKVTLTPADPCPRMSKGRVHQQMYEFELTNEDSSCIKASFAILHSCVEELIHKLLPDWHNLFEKKLNLNKIRMHDYPMGSIGITPHVDGESNINLIVVVLLQGHADFVTYASRPGPETGRFRMQGRDMIVMRSCGFLPNSSMVMHSFHPMRGGCTTLGFRQLAV